MDLTAAFKDFQKCARVLGKYEEISINDLANNYCKAIDEQNSRNQDIYFSALIMRFWYKINKMYQENPTLNLDYIDYYEGLIDAIQQACRERYWQKNTSVNAQQVINKILATRFVAQKYYEANLLKNKGKTFIASLDAPLEEGNEDSDSLSDILVNENENLIDSNNEEIYSLVQHFIDKNKLIEAIIIDNIAFTDSVKYEKENVKTTDLEGNTIKYTNYYSTFWPHKIVKALSDLNEEYRQYFNDTYRVSEPALEAAMTVIERASSQKKYKYIESAQAVLKKAYAL